MVASHAVRAAHLRARALVDLAELREQKLPGFSVHFDDADTSKICLIVEPIEGHLAGLKIHFDVDLPAEFPLVPVAIKNSTKLEHPNVFGDWICLDILKTEDEMQYYRTPGYTGGFTPGYSLLGIFQQVASFFGTDNIPQSFGGWVKVTPNGGAHRRRIAIDGARSFRCNRCSYQPPSPSPLAGWTTTPDWIVPGRQRTVASRAAPLAPGSSLLEPNRVVVGLPLPSTKSKRKAQRRRMAKAKGGLPSSDVVQGPSTSIDKALHADPDIVEDEPREDVSEEKPPSGPCVIDRLNEDVLFLIFQFLPTTDLLSLARAYPLASQLCANSNIIAAREIRCFVTKKSAGETTLGIGVSWNAQLKGLESSFDLLSHEAFEDLEIRMGLRRERFTHWLPLAIHDRHFSQSRKEIVWRLKTIERALVLGPGKGGAGRREPSMDGYLALCSFANEIVVRLMKTADEVLTAQPEHVDSYECTCEMCSETMQPPNLATSPAGTLLHASEKALCDFISIVHLAVSLAATNPLVAQHARNAVTRFIRYSNARNKDATPDLGVLLVQAALCGGDIGLDTLRGPLLQEALTRHVVWMLDSRQGAGHSGLALLEPEAVSEWRLATTFTASRTGLRLLMFQWLFLRELSSIGQQPGLQGLKDGLDARYGLPPPDMPARLVQSVKDIYAVNNFAGFSRHMGLPAPGKAWMTRFLRARIQESEAREYHRTPVSYSVLLRARLLQDPEWAQRTMGRQKIKAGLTAKDKAIWGSFFPNRYSSAAR